MKKMFTILLILSVVLSTNAQTKKWVYDKAVPDSAVSASFFNSIHGMVVDPEGKIWVQDYYVSTKDTVQVTIKGVPTWKRVRVLRVYKPDGTETPFSPIVTCAYPGGKDTLSGWFRASDSTWQENTGRGLGLAPDGNILASYFGNIYKINYKTGAGMMKIVVDLVNSLTRPVSDSSGTIFVANVAPGFGLRMYSATGTSLGNAVDATVGFSRGFEVSYDGNTIFWAGYDKMHVKRYTRPDDLSPFTYKDSILVGMTAESMFRDPVQKNNIWVCAGPADAPPGAPYTPHTWYKVDVKTAAISDSVTYPGLAPTADTKHRAATWTITGDTCYLSGWAVTAAQFTAPKIVRMVKKPVSVRPEPNAVITGYALEQNFPNPFNPSTSIRFTVALEGNVMLKVYDLLGREVATLVNENLKAGGYSTEFDASGLASGTYIYKLSANGTSVSRKMSVLK